MIVWYKLYKILYYLRLGIVSGINHRKILYWNTGSSKESFDKEKYLHEELLEVNN